MTDTQLPTSAAVPPLSPIATSQPTMPNRRSEASAREILERLGQLEQVVEDELSNYAAANSESLAQLPADFKLSIVIPVYNELNTIARVIARVDALSVNKEIVIVDDCSTDGTWELLQKLPERDSLKLVRHEKNSGKGAALRTGFANTTGGVVVVQDADLEYDPSDIPGVILPIARGETDIVYGSRFIGEEQQDESWIHRAGNAVLTQSLNAMIGLKLTDMETCYKAFRGDAIRGLEIRQNRFGVEPEMTAKLARRGFRFQEVPISYNARTYAEGKKIGIKDLFNALWCIVRYGYCD